MGDRIEEIRARWAAVESAPWVHREGDPDVDSVAGGLVAIVAPFANVRTVIAQGADYNHFDAEAIAHAPEDVAHLLATIAAREDGAWRAVDDLVVEGNRRLEAESRAEGYRIERDEAVRRADAHEGAADRVRELEAARERARGVVLNLEAELLKERRASDAALTQRNEARAQVAAFRASARGQVVSRIMDLEAQLATVRGVVAAAAEAVEARRCCCHEHGAVCSAHFSDTAGGCACGACQRASKAAEG